MNYFKSKKNFEEDDFVFVYLSSYSGKRIDCMAQIVQFGGDAEHSTMFIRRANNEIMTIKWGSNTASMLELVNSRLLK